MRIEGDMVGSQEIPEGAYYGLQSLRAAGNFKITGTGLIPEFIESMAEIKKAAARTNCEIGKLDSARADAIIRACDEVLSGKLRDQFITDAVQGGAGTSANMNMNEVIANRAIEIMGGQKGDYTVIHPNDHVNMAQSTNDVIPTAGKMTVIKLIRGAIAQTKRLIDALTAKEKEFDHILKMGRTQMQDAVPIRLGQEFGAYRSVIQRSYDRLLTIPEELMYVNMGGTAIGTCINADPNYVKRIVPALAEISALNLKSAPNLIDATQNLDGFVSVSATLKTVAINLSKIANDLRIMSSGPRTGFHEINLPPRQNGSSIMPGKVNPVIPEVVNQVAFGIIGKDVTITLAAEAGQLELNVMEPIIAFTLFTGIRRLARAFSTLQERCVAGITANADRCRQLVENSIGIVTALNTRLGYETSASIAKEALESGRSVMDLVLEKQLLTREELDELLLPENMIHPFLK